MPVAGARIEEVELSETVGRSSAYKDTNVRKRVTSLADYPELERPFESYKKLQVMTQRERIWVTRLVIMSIIDLGVSAMVASLAFSTAYWDSGLSLYCIGMQAVAHLISSVITILRYWKESRWGRYGSKDGRPDNENQNDDEEASLLTERKRDFTREQKLSIAIGVILLLTSAVLMFKAARKFKFWEQWHKDSQATRATSDQVIMKVCEVLAWKSGGMYALQAAIRYFARLDTDGHLEGGNKFTNHIFWVSFSSCLFCFVLGLSASYQKEWSWKAEPIAASILSIGSCIEGMRILYVYFDDPDEILTRHTRP